MEGQWNQLKVIVHVFYALSGMKEDNTNKLKHNTMKKTLHLKRVLRIALIVLLLGMAKTYAQTTFTVGDLNYAVNDDGVSVTVTGHVYGLSATGDLIIPETVSFNSTEYEVAEIGDCAFLGCNNLTGNLVIPNTVVAIGLRAFKGCSGFSGTLTLSNTLSSIGHEAFNGDSGITSVSIPNTVEYLGECVFNACVLLEQITVEEGNPFYDSRNNCNAIIITSTNTLREGCKSTIIPNSITEIGACAFTDHTGLTEIDIPNTVKEIGSSAFSHTGLVSLDIPNSVNRIGSFAFSSCESLNNLIIPNSVTTIEMGAFGSCSGLTSVTIGSSVISIGNLSFINCNSIDTFISLATTPPILEGENVFKNVTCVSLTVPCGCSFAYESSAWHDHFTTIQENCTGIEKDEINIATAYPNPTSGVVHIKVKNLHRISIFNSLGQQVYDTQVDGDMLECDLSEHQAGVYLIRIETAMGIDTKRVILTK